MTLIVVFQLQKCDTTEELQKMLQSENFQFIFECGYSKLISSVDITCKEEIIKCIWLHYAFFAIHAEVQQLPVSKRGTFVVGAVVLTQHHYRFLSGSSNYPIMDLISALLKKL